MREQQTDMTEPVTIPRLPFAFWLEDRLDKSAIFIVDPEKRAEQRLNLFIENTAEQTLFFAATNLDQKPPSRENCHFELRFRRGLLADESLKKSKMKGQERSSMELLLTGKYQKRAYDIGSWVISEPDDHDGIEPYISFYLARSEKGSGGRFGPGERQQLVLTNISAAPEGDTRESRVELVPRNVYYDAPKQVGARPVTEPREQNVLVVNHLGKEFIPLHLAFIGPYTLRNDGEPQGAGHQLRLRLTNTSPHDTIAFTPKSRLLFAFDFAEGDQEEELGTAGDVAKIKFYFNEQRDENEMVLHPEMAQNPIWELGHNLELATRQLAPHQHWDILINTSAFVTHAPAGLTPLHFTYESIPGYWDGKLFASVEKTPLVVRTTGEQEPKVVEMDTGQRPLYITGKVGIGTTIDPNEQLNIKGNSTVDGRLQVTGNVGIGTNMPESKLHVVGDSTLNGDVTIGKESNPKSLEVHGRIKDQTGYLMPVGSIIAYGGNEAPEGWLLCDGKQISVQEQPCFGGVDKGAALREVLGKNKNDPHGGWNTPDLRSRFIVGAGQGPNLSSYPLGHTDGEEKVTLKTPEMPAHTHAGTVDSSGSHSHNSGKSFRIEDDYNRGDYEVYVISTGQGWDVNTGAGGSHTHTLTISSTGENLSHNNLPPYYALTYIIKY
jgi:microcystin-dependent protein